MAKSSSKNKTKKPVERTLQGLVFFKHCTKETYVSVLAWVEAGGPDNASIFDTVDTLLACGIFICDAAPTRGMYRRVPPIKARKCVLRLSKHLVCKLIPAEVKTTEKGVNVAETKAHHVMIY